LELHFGETHVIIEDLGAVGPDATIEADLIIIGSGPAGLTIAREFFGTSTRVLVLESGQREEACKFDDLNAVESIGEPQGDAQMRKRVEFHGTSSASWSCESQQYGVRCRVFGGSSKVWAGKSAAFDPIDYTVRDWIPFSGWPFEREALDPYVDRAAEVLNLGPNCYDDRLWELAGISPPEPQLDPKLLKSFFWQFARSRIDTMDVMRFGSEFIIVDESKVRVLLNATVTRIDTNEAGTVLEGVEVTTIDRVRSRVRAKAAVLAAGGIENPRLLLASNNTRSRGLGNQNDVVGRFLMDHPGARIGHFRLEDCPAVVKRFGFYGVKHLGRSHLYMHGLAPSREFQERERLMHCAAYMQEERAPDDPWDALKRLLRKTSKNPISDLGSVGASPGLLAKGIGIKMFESNLFPQQLKDLVINAIIKKHPNFVVREFQSRGLPHKLAGVVIDGITEQCPDPESRITLSDKTDALGVPIARANWRVDQRARNSLIRLAKLLEAEFFRVGLPKPILEPWVAEEKPENSVIIDMGHTMGTTRISDNPKDGVVDPKCQVYGVDGLYVAGASVFPTSGHANPTLMILALAIRLADQIKIDLAC
jgi:choline dehydrogenase-like flavoprotein